VRTDHENWSWELIMRTDHENWSCLYLCRQIVNNYRLLYLDLDPCHILRRVRWWSTHSIGQHNQAVRLMYWSSLDIHRGGRRDVLTNRSIQCIKLTITYSLRKIPLLLLEMHMWHDQTHGFSQVYKLDWDLCVTFYIIYEEIATGRLRNEFL